AGSDRLPLGLIRAALRRRSDLADVSGLVRNLRHRGIVCFHNRRNPIGGVVTCQTVLPVREASEVGDLELVRDFVNTLEFETGVDELGPWLAERLGRRPTGQGLARAERVREALRALLLANNGVSADVAAAETELDSSARRARLALRFGAGARLEGSAAGTDAVLGEILAAVAKAMADGRWGRLKACRADDCRWVFLDNARNRSRVWCSMAVCGNRTKTRAYRARARNGR